MPASAVDVDVQIEGPGKMRQRAWWLPGKSPEARYVFFHTLSIEVLEYHYSTLSRMLSIRMIRFCIKYIYLIQNHAPQSQKCDPFEIFNLARHPVFFPVYQPLRSLR